MTPSGMGCPSGPALTPGCTTIKTKLHITIFSFLSVEEGKVKQEETSSGLLSLVWLPEKLLLCPIYPAQINCQNISSPLPCLPGKDYVPLADLSCN